jgi:protein SCO1
VKAAAAAAAALAAAVAAGAVWRAAPSPLAGARLPGEGSAQELPVLYPLPPFSLLQSSGRPLGREDLVGRPFVAAFIFTRCAGVCPRMTAQMVRLRERLPDPFRLVSFTVDPVHDTPAVLDRHARALQAGPRWLFVTGDQVEIHRLAVQGFKLATEALPPDRAADEGPFLHSPKLVLVDEQAHVRGYYDSDDGQDMEDLVRDAGRLSPPRAAAQ